MKIRSFYFLLILLLVINCQQESKSKLPPDISYQIIEKDPNSAISKLTLRVRLNKEVNEENLQIIAGELRQKYDQYDKVWIFYHLPNMSTDMGAWATSHFKPNLEMQIIGALKADSEAMKNTKVSGTILNSWVDNDAIAPNQVYLVSENGKLFMKSVYAKTKYVNASEIVEELTESKSGGLTRYTYSNDHGEYYIVEKNGNLGLYNSDGKFKDLPTK